MTVIIKHKVIFLFFFFLLLLGFSTSSGQCQNLGVNNDFHFLLWPLANGWISTATEPEQVNEQLLNSWYQAHLPTYMKLNLRVHRPQTKSLRNYVAFVNKHEPHCIEGNFEFIQQEINQPEPLYSKILTISNQQPQDKPNAELIIRNDPSGWEGILGVVHPLLSQSGKAQIAYWKEETGEDPDWIAFYSADEVIRHLLAGQEGSIQAAALPAGAFEQFLTKIGRQDLADLFTIIPLTTPPSPTTIFLRNDVYEDLLQKTLIRETWLRNSFPDFMKLTSFIVDE